MEPLPDLRASPGAERLVLAPVSPTVDRLRRAVGGSGELANPHPEMPVSNAVRQRAKDAAVLVPFIDSPEGLRLLVTRRHPGIRFGGHMCFPGGRVDPQDADPVAAALRETSEEIGVAPQTVEILGTYGQYFTQTGYRIVPVLGVLREPEAARCSAEVESIHELDAARVLSGEHYRVTWYGNGRGHVAYEEAEIRVAGPTVSLMIGLHRCLLERQ